MAALLPLLSLTVAAVAPVPTTLAAPLLPVVEPVLARASPLPGPVLPAAVPVLSPALPAIAPKPLPLAALLPLVRPPQPIAGTASQRPKRKTPRTSRLMPQSDIGPLQSTSLQPPERAHISRCTNV
jgi:hypothetical protein